MKDLRALRAEAVTCRRCPLWRTGTQTVFGEGRAEYARFVGDLRVLTGVLR